MSLRIGLLALDTLPSDRNALLSLAARLPFGADELARLSRLRNPAALRQSVGALLVLEDLLREAKISPQPILRAPMGKPYAAQPSFPCFSMTHTEDYAAAVLGEEPDVQVGIDIEREKAAQRHSQIAKRFFTAEEWHRFREGGESPEAFYRLWTKKEALAKLHGNGLFTDLPISADTVSFRLRIGDERYCLTVASENMPDEIRWSHQIKELSIHELQN